jgi:transposase
MKEWDIVTMPDGSPAVSLNADSEKDWETLKALLSSVRNTDSLYLFLGYKGDSDRDIPGDSYFAMVNVVPKTPATEDNEFMERRWKDFLIATLEQASPREKEKAV